LAADGFQRREERPRIVVVVGRGLLLLRLSLLACGCGGAMSLGDFGSCPALLLGDDPRNGRLGESGELDQLLGRSTVLLRGAPDVVISDFGIEGFPMAVVQEPLSIIGVSGLDEWDD